MKWLSAILTLLLFSSCIAPREIDDRACKDPEYLHLLRVPMDSMSPKEFAYFQMKDRECQEATAAANAVHQQQVGQQEDILLGLVLSLFAAIILTLKSL